MARVLLTGAGGFLAGPLAERLKGRRPMLARHRDWELADPSAARGLVREARPSLVIHLAGRTRPGAWEEYWASHVSATVNLLEALACEGRPVKVVVVGSAAEFGAAAPRVAGEDAPCEPLSLYGSSKLSQTLAALSYSRGPLQVVVARLFNVLGPGTPENLAPGAFAKQIAAIEAGRQAPELLVGDLSPKRDYLDARDAASALLALAARGRGGEVYNVGAGRSTSMRAVLDGLLAASTAKVHVKVDPARLRKAEVQDLAAATGKLRRETGWRPELSLARSLADTLDWWRGR